MIENIQHWFFVKGIDVPRSFIVMLLILCGGGIVLIGMLLFGSSGAKPSVIPESHKTELLNGPPVPVGIKDKK